MTTTDPYAYLEDVIKDIFEVKGFRESRLIEFLDDKVLPEDRIKKIEKRLGKDIHPKNRFHLPELMKKETPSPGGDMHRNAIIHSGNTLKYILDIIQGNSNPPPPWVC